MVQSGHGICADGVYFDTRRSENRENKHQKCQHQVQFLISIHSVSLLYPIFFKYGVLNFL